MAYQPKSYKKFVATAATATLVATAVVPAAFANEAETAAFKDVPKSYEAAIEFVVSNNISDGLTETEYGIDKQIKRGDAAIIIANAAGLNNIDAPAAGFKDVPTRGALQINSLKALGVVNGKSTTNFGFEDPIKRGEAAIMLQRAFKLTGDVNDVKFTDVSDRYEEAVAALLAYDVTKGTSTTKFGTENPIKRGDFAKFIYALEDFVVKVPTTDVASVTAVNAKELQIKFNKAVKESSVVDANDDLLAGVISLNSTDASSLTDSASLSADGKTLTLVATDTWKGSYAFEIAKDKIETTDGKKLGEYKEFVTAKDEARPTFTGLSYEPSGAAKFSFSEPLDETATTIASKLVVNGATAVTVTDADVKLADDKKSFTVALPAAMTKDASYTFTYTGLKDFAGNLLSPNPLSATVVKADRDTVKPTVTNVVALDTGKLQVTFSEKIQTAGALVTVGGTDYTTYTLDTTGTVATFTGVAKLTAGVQSVTIKDAKDLAGLKLEDVTRVIQVTADTTAPAYVNHTVETVGGKRFLVVNYNEEITADATKSVTGTYVDANSITKTMSPITDAAITTGTDKKSVRIQLPATAGTYTVTLPAGLAVDTSAAKNTSVAKNVSFNLATAVDSAKPVTKSFGQSGNKVTVTFDKDVTAATALNVNNYTIDGVSSPFETAIFKGDAKTVELTLKNDVITTDGVRNYTVSNVATSAGSVMLPETLTYDFQENVRPTVQSAKVTSATTIEVTLTEALKSTTVGTDFDVLQGSSATPLKEAVSGEALSGTNKVIITLDSPLESLNGLTLTASSTIDLTDLNGNAVNFVGPIAVSSN